MCAQVCRHKAAPVAEGSGCVKMFECMYHGWQYGEQGKATIKRIPVSHWDPQQYLDIHGSNILPDYMISEMYRA